MADKTEIGGFDIVPVTRQNGDVVYVRADHVNTPRPQISAFDDKGRRTNLDISREDISGAPDGSGFWNTSLGQYLGTSYDALKRGVKQIPDAAEHAWESYAKPALEAGAQMLPGAGFVQGAQDARGARDAFNKGDYGRAAVDAASSMLNTGFEAIPGAHAATAAVGKMAPAIFAGIAAKTADREALKSAQQMAERGASRGDIWAETGWFQGPDQKWRFEIADDKARMTGATPEKTGSSISPYRPIPLHQVLDHPQLYEAYPDMREARVMHFDDFGPGASYDRAEGDRAGTISLDMTRPSSLSDLLHEAQHGVQDLEEFPSGLSPHAGPLSAYDPVLEAPFMTEDTPAQRFDAYRRAAGEVEARNVSERAGYGNNSRKGIAPWESEDVPADMQWTNASRDDIRRTDEANQRYLAMNTAKLDASSLPMDEASRMARAREMGYADEPFYRGEASGTVPVEYPEKVNYFSRDQEYSKGFAKRGGNSEPREFRLRIDSISSFPTHSPVTVQQYVKALDAISEYSPEMSKQFLDDVAPGKTMDWLRRYASRYPDQIAAESGGLIWQPLERLAGVEGAAMAMRRAGFETIDTGRDVINLTGQGIRSKDAAFDPAKAASRNIFYGAGAVGVGSMAASSSGDMEEIR